MDFVIQLFLMSDANLVALIFLITGVVVYFVDYKMFKQKSANYREAKFSRGAAYVYILGGAVLMMGLRVVDWLS